MVHSVVYHLHYLNINQVVSSQFKLTEVGCIVKFAFNTFP
jgi:hypothetical protein